jgi:hypothetical protein
LLESFAHADYPTPPIQRRAFGCFMSERQESPYDSIVRRWLALVERREQHLADLSRSGRWRHYSHAEFLDEMRKALHAPNQ